MKKVLIALLGLLCGLLFSACGAREEDGENVWQVYYVSNSETKEIGRASCRERV